MSASLSASESTSTSMNTSESTNAPMNRSEFTSGSMADSLAISERDTTAQTVETKSKQKNAELPQMGDGHGLNQGGILVGLGLITSSLLLAKKKKKADE